MFRAFDTTPLGGQGEGAQKQFPWGNKMDAPPLGCSDFDVFEKMENAQAYMDAKFKSETH